VALGAFGGGSKSQHVSITTAAILARGLGSRMRREDAAAQLDGAQSVAADSGMKGMIPIRRPFLDYALSALADAGITQVVLVIGPEHEAVRRYFVEESPPQRVSVRFAVQAEALGTANAVVAAALTIGDTPFLVLNADNYYPVDALRALSREARAGTIAFDRDALVRDGNIDAERVRAFAVLEVDESGRLRGIVEKPGASLDLSSEAARWVGMNCWAITPALVDACARVPKSARGEFELPEAVALAIREGVEVAAIKMSAPVLDLSRRSDILSVVAHLAAVDPRP
jgi:UDP-N-acetylglucosamine diphosphorylase / glucose-1-phosphate thymidylyltransferase / UDP-N-acetylgalactosamine diphosphorylase / glucosamine-1-phosphate N-acetyltransferase / galactosamine-1-phosphate N-acetyltransferase